MPQRIHLKIAAYEPSGEFNSLSSDVFFNIELSF